MEKKISVIVPVYNTEKYLRECIDSILCQTYSNFELILIDDGSTDDSLSICSAYRTNSKVVVLHQENKGQSAARNKGLSVAKGEFITFVDSDDLVERNYLERLLDAATKYNADWVQCGAHFGSTRVLAGAETHFEKVFSGKNALLDDSIKVRLCGVLYKASLLSGLQFPGYRIYEDDAVFYKIVYNSNTAVRITDELYYYYFKTDSVSKKEPDFINDSFIEIGEERIKYFTDIDDDKMIIKSKEHLCRSLIVLYIRCRKSATNKNDKDKYLRMIRKLTKEIVFSTIPTMKSKLECIGVSTFPGIVFQIAVKYKLNVRF
jgi:glycosyltransferase involved in cell wall biosynthesis